MRVRVYRNLHKKTFSVLDPRNRKVIAYSNQILLQDVTFIVSAAGRNRAIRTRHRNVHAMAEGILLGFNDLDHGDVPLREVTYNPFFNEGFVFADNGAAVSHADLVWFNSPKCFISN